MDELLTSWFADPTRAFRHDVGFDDELRTRFGALHAETLAGQHEDWRATIRGTLAYVIVLDQLSRNLHRGTERMFEGDARARIAAIASIDRGDDFNLSEVERGFLYMPLMHSESLADQDRSVELFRERCPAQLSYAEQHRDLIRRFGRFPHRNRAVGRASTPDEEAFLVSDQA
jgi:uncharacterized protein (DUF924 family)